MSTPETPASTPTTPTTPPTPPPPGNDPLVLVVEDEAPIRRFLRATLEANHFRVKDAGTSREGSLLAVTARPDFILLDLGLPDGDGLQFLRSLRAESAVPIIVLSARGQETDKIAALDLGADDYLTKPFGVGELLARMRVALRHAAAGGPRTATGEPRPYEATADGRTLRIDLLARRVHIADAQGRHEVRLTPMELKLLSCLARHAGRLLTHAMILREVWGPQHEADVHYLRVYAAELRKKLERDPAQPEFLLTEPGIGYRLRDADAPA